MIPVSRPYLGAEEKSAVLRVIDSGMLAQGEIVRLFEEDFAKFIGVKHAIAVSNGTTALHIALLANNIGYGDEVITTPFSFIATANVIKMVGATPVFVDIDEYSFNIDPKKIASAITTKTKAVMPVHLFGRAAQMDEIQKIAQKHNLIIIEDSCQSHGAHFNNQKTGSFGTGCFSFYPTKNITTGEGGMITTNSDEVARKARLLINHGSEKKYYHSTLGYNYRMTNLSAAIGIEQLKKLSFFNQKRIENAALLNENLKNIKGLITPQIIPGHIFHQYTIRITLEFSLSREELVKFLNNKKIGTGIFYPLPIHKQEAFRRENCLSFPVSEKLSKEVLSLPVHPQLTKEELDYIISTFEELKK